MVPEVVPAAQRRLIDANITLPNAGTALENQHIAAINDARVRATARRDALRGSVTPRVDDFRAFQTDIQQTVNTLRPLSPNEHVDQTVKELEAVGREIDENIRNFTPPASSTQQTPQQIVDSLQQGQRRARTMTERWTAFQTWVSQHGGNTFVSGFLGFGAEFFKSMPFDFMKKWGEKLERLQAPHHIRKVMTEALPANMQNRVVSGTNDVEDARLVREEYENKKRINANNFNTTHPDFDSYIKGRMREVHQNRINIRYTVHDLIEQANLTPQQRKEQQDNARKTESENRARSGAEQLEYNERLNRKYVVAIAKAFKNAGYKGFDDKVSGWETDANGTVKTSATLATELCVPLRGKASVNTAADWRLYLHDGSWHEYDCRRSGLLGMGYLWQNTSWLTHDNAFPGLANWETTVTGNPHDAAHQFISYVTSQAFNNDTSSGFDPVAKQSMVRIRAQLMQGLAGVGGLDDLWARRNDPRPQENNDKAAADKKAKADKEIAEKNTKAPPVA